MLYIPAVVIRFRYINSHQAGSTNILEGFIFFRIVMRVAKLT